MKKQLLVILTLFIGVSVFAGKKPKPSPPPTSTLPCTPPLVSANVQLFFGASCTYPDRYTTGNCYLIPHPSFSDPATSTGTSNPKNEKWKWSLKITVTADAPSGCSQGYSSSQYYTSSQLNYTWAIQVPSDRSYKVAVEFCEGDMTGCDPRLGRPTYVTEQSFGQGTMHYHANLQYKGTYQ